MTIDAQQLADRSAAVWNEPDAVVRRAEIERLWRPDGEHYQFIVAQQRVQSSPLAYFSSNRRFARM